MSMFRSPSGIFGRCGDCLPNSQKLEKGEYCACLQKGEERWSGEHQASHFIPWSNHGVHPLGAHPWLHEGEGGDWDSHQSLTRVYHAWTSWLPRVINWFVDKWRAGYNIYFWIGKASSSLDWVVMFRGGGRWAVAAWRGRVLQGLLWGLSSLLSLVLSWEVR